jgi:SAM-dependent methyltransferase
MTAIPCPLCGNTFSCEQWWRHSSCHVRCPKCRTIVLVGAPEDSPYPDEYFGSKLTKFSGWAGKARKFWHKKRADRMALMLRGTKQPRVYDIGCGDGEFLLACQRKGFDVGGFEPVQQPRDQATHRLGLKIDAELFQDGESEGYDVISAWQVVEHVSDPKTMLTEARKRLKPGGILAVSTVNLESVQSRLFGKFWLHLDPPRHVWVGERRAVENFVEKCGFEIVARVWNNLEFGPVGYVDSVINLFDTRRDRLLHCLKTGFEGYGNKLLWLVAAGLAPLGVIGSAAEAAIGKPATFELYAK